MEELEKKESLSHIKIWNTAKGVMQFETKIVEGFTSEEIDRIKQKALKVFEELDAVSVATLERK